MARILDVSSPNGPYPIIIQKGLLQQSQLPWPGGLNPQRAVVIADSNLASLYDSLWEGHRLPLLSFEAGEVNKHLETIHDLYHGLLEIGAGRDSAILAFGGGVTGDTAGFAAASYMRGVPLIQLPTSLLAMVDACVGGKTGVNLPQGKNLVGAFHHPTAVWIDPTVLQTLPARELRSGLAEVVKYGLLSDPRLLLPENLEKHRVEDMIAWSLEAKAHFVEEDPNERGRRAYLNLGHTFAHGIETLSDYQWTHGEAVAVGMVMATRLSTKLGWMSEESVEELEDLLASIGLPTRLKDVVEPGHAQQLWNAMQTDKKKKGGGLRFVLLQGSQNPVVAADVPRELVLETMEEVVL